MLLHWDWLTPALERCEVEGCGLGLGAKRWWLQEALGARSWGEGWGEGEDRAWIVLYLDPARAGGGAAEGGSHCYSRDALD